MPTIARRDNRIERSCVMAPPRPGTSLQSQVRFSVTCVCARMDRNNGMRARAIRVLAIVVLDGRMVMALEHRAIVSLGRRQRQAIWPAAAAVNNGDDDDDGKRLIIAKRVQIVGDEARRPGSEAAATFYRLKPIAGGVRYCQWVSMKVPSGWLAASDPDGELRWRAGSIYYYYYYYLYT